MQVRSTTTAKKKTKSKASATKPQQTPDLHLEREAAIFRSLDSHQLGYLKREQILVALKKE